MTHEEAATGAFPDPDPLAYEKSDEGAHRYRNAVLKVTYQREGYVKRMQEEDQEIARLREALRKIANRDWIMDGNKTLDGVCQFAETALAPPVLPVPTSDDHGK